MMEWMTSHPWESLSIVVAALMILSAAGHAIRPVAPRAGQVMIDIGVNVLGVLRTLFPGRVPPLSVLVFAAVVGGGASACVTTSHARDVADSVGDAARSAEPVIRAVCVDGYRKAPDLAAVDRLDRVCLPAARAWDATARAHVALVAAIAAVESGQRGDLPAATMRAAQTATALARALEVLR